MLFYIRHTILHTGNAMQDSRYIHLFKITGKLTPDKVKLNKHYIWDILDIDWKVIKVTFNGKVINLPKSITAKLWDKF